MSTTFNVYPGISKVPSFGEVIGRSEERLWAFLNDCGIHSKPRILVTLRQKEPDIVLPLDIESPTRWSEDKYAWFSVPPVLGGTDAYFHNLDDWDHEYWEELIQRDDTVCRQKDLVQRCLSVGCRWTFRRSAGQPAIIHLAYGLIAASFAELTHGFIYSDDSAWDYQRFPALAEEFDQWYFRPEQSIGPNHREWSERCIATIRESVL